MVGAQRQHRLDRAACAAIAAGGDHLARGHPRQRGVGGQRGRDGRHCVAKRAPAPALDGSGLGDQRTACAHGVALPRAAVPVAIAPIAVGITETVGGRTAHPLDGADRWAKLAVGVDHIQPAGEQERKAGNGRGEGHRTRHARLVIQLHDQGRLLGRLCGGAQTEARTQAHPQRGGGEQGQQQHAQDVARAPRR